MFNSFPLNFWMVLNLKLSFVLGFDLGGRVEFGFGCRWILDLD